MATEDTLALTRPHKMHLQWLVVPPERQPEWYGFCECGRRGTPSVILKHVRASRRWRYLGTEEHFGTRYYLWEHQLTGRRYAWQVDGYFVATMLGKNWASPRGQQ